MCGIIRGQLYSELIPNNLGVIFRKEFTDLRDSTLRDFEELKGLKVNSQRNYDFPNRSRIMFRHLEELNNLQNLNLGWFFIEQAEELSGDKEFFLLWGRLRRSLKPSQEFLSLGLPVHTGFITGNVKGSNWIKALWKDSPKAGFSLNEAVTYDNADVLPEDYLKNLDALKTLRPAVYAQYVMNDWSVEAQGKVFRGQFVDGCVRGNLEEPKPGVSYCLGVDLAKYSDFTVILVLRKDTGQIVYFDRFNEISWALQKARVVAVAQRYNNAEVIPDSTGVGDPVVEDLERAGLNVCRSKDRAGFVFTSTSKEQLIENLIIGIENRFVSIPSELEILISEMKDFEIEITKAGNVRYSAPSGRNDDCVIALALAYWGARTADSYISITNILTGQRL